MGNKNNQQKDGQGTRKALETQAAQRLAARPDRQCKSKATRREMTTQCQQILANGNPTYIGDIERSTSRLASCIAPLLYQMISMKGLNYQ
jgi:hypothetical protein